MDLGEAGKQLVPRSLLGRSLLIIVVPLLLLQLVLAYVFYENHWQHVTRRLAQDAADEIVLLARLFEAYPRLEHPRIARAATALDLEVALSERRHLAAVPAAGLGPVERTLATMLAEKLARPATLAVESGERKVVVAIQIGDAVLEVAVPRRRLESFTTYVFVLWMVGSATLLLAIAIIFMRNQVRSVKRLADAADAFGKGHDVPDFKPEGAREVRQAAIAFNLMRARLRRQIAQRTEMLAGVSHDLRTPLTRMKLQLAMMDEADGVVDLREDVAEMERMVDGYLAFARGEGSEKVVESDLNALLDDVVARFRRDGAGIDLHCEGDITLPLRPHAFDRCLSNLIANAVRHATHVRLRAGQRQKAIEILVDDDGPGIPAGQREEVFKAFFRLEGSRNPKTGGVGLGLTIARDVVRSLGGEICLEDSPLGGLRVRIRLPL